MNWAFRSFRSRLLVFLLGLMVLVQGAVLVAVGRANAREARRHVDDALALTARAFGRALDVRNRILLEKARLLSSDFAFKQAVATGEPETVRSVLENHRDRVGADVMMLVEMDGSLAVDTLHTGVHEDRCPLERPVDVAEESEFGEAQAVEFVDGVPYQLVVVPLYTPEPTAWIVIGFRIDDAFAKELREETGTHVSLLEWRNETRPFASTLEASRRADLARALESPEARPRESLVLALGSEDYVTWIVPVPHATGADDEREIVAVLQRSLHDALAPYLRLRGLLFGILGVGLGLSGLGGVLLATRVTRPVDALARGARRIAEGDYESPVVVAQQDELGMLASSFNTMMQGLSERDRVRDLLGKVVSREVAEELLTRGVELGGEERTVSVLFSDVRNFTSIAERKSPQELVGFLNGYLTRVSEIVERHGGVVDKYIGDAVMALFGAPLSGEDDAIRAVRTGLDMAAALRDLRAEDLRIGVGINTDVVVAGNMGSRSRLNYTVIGDGVNLASRLEGLTKRFGVDVIVSETTCAACPGWSFRELDRVRVKGKRQPVRIYEPVGETAALDPALRERLERHAAALEAYRARRFEEALEAFDALMVDGDPRLYRYYRTRILELRERDLPPAWDGTSDFDEK